jgi:hypothetical protein
VAVKSALKMAQAHLGPKMPSPMSAKSPLAMPTPGNLVKPVVPYIPRIGGALPTTPPAGSGLPQAAAGGLNTSQPSALGNKSLLTATMPKLPQVP